MVEDTLAERADELGRTVRPAVADGHRLSFSEDTFETVICTLAICDVDDRAATLGEGVGLAVAERQRLWAGHVGRVRLVKPG